MAGEIWRGSFQIGKETTPGTSVPATRKMYFNTDGVLTYERETRPHRFQVGRRDNVLKRTSGPIIAGGNVVQDVSADENLELYLMGIKGAVTPITAPAGTLAQLWTFKPDPVLDAATVEWHDGARGWEETGVYASSLNWAGNVREGNTLTAELFGMNLVQDTITPALADRTPSFYEGWETALYIDNLGGTPGTTQVLGELISWDITYNNNMARKYFAENTLAAKGISSGELEIDATLVFEASPAAVLTEFTNWTDSVDRLVSLKFGNNRLLETGVNSQISIDIPGDWTAVTLGGTDEGTRTYELSFGFVYDSVLAAGFQVRATTLRTAAY